MRLGYVMSPGKGHLDPILERFARALMQRGTKLAGVVQLNTEVEGNAPCDMDALVLPNGPVVRISQSLGPGAKGCRLDAAGLEQAVGEVAARLEQGVDLLLINKFGKQEGEGGGFRPVIGEAMTRGIPVLVGLNGLNREGFDRFTEGVADQVEPDLAALFAWFDDRSA